MKFLNLFSICCSILLYACGEKGVAPLAGGFGSETTNGVRVSGTSQKGVELLARRVDGGANDVSTRTDEDGFWEMLLTAGDWNIVGQSKSGEAFAQAISLRPTDREFDAGSTELQPLGSLYGTIVDGCPDDTVRILGRPGFQAGVSFRFDSLPQGTYMVRLKKLGQTLETRVVQTGREIVFDLTDPSLVLGDFNDSADLFPLSPLLNGGWQVWGNDSLRDSLGKRLSGDPLYYLTNSGAWKGGSFHATVVAGKAATQDDRLSVVLKFGSRKGLLPADASYDLSFSDSLVFQAKGKGTVRLSIWMATSTTNDSNIVFFHREFDLQSDWARVGYSWKDLLEADAVASQGLESPRVVKVVWAIHEGDFWLDDVRITPGRAEMFLRQ